MSLRIYTNTLHARHAGRQEMFRGRMVDSHEVPARLQHVLDELQRRPVGTLQPVPQGLALDAALARVHTPDYLQFLAGAWDEWVALDPANAGRDALASVWPLPSRHAFRTDALPHNFAARLGRYAFDAGTPLTDGSWVAARAGAACALAAALDVARHGGGAFALTRPPGHHAGADFMGGYCFLNNAAVAAQALRDAGQPRVAVLDIDYHHGNGTQAIFYERADVLTVSIHGDPRTEYPFFIGHADERGAGAGEGFNLNLPLARGSRFAVWQRALERALQAVGDFRPQALVVAMGLDTFAGDPIAGFGLESPDYLEVGRALGGLKLPTVITFEGGYAVAEVGVNAVNVLEGWQRAA